MKFIGQRIIPLVFIIIFIALAENEVIPPVVANGGLLVSVLAIILGGFSFWGEVNWRRADFNFGWFRIIGFIVLSMSINYLYATHNVLENVALFNPDDSLKIEGTTYFKVIHTAEDINQARLEYEEAYKNYFEDGFFILLPYSIGSVLFYLSFFIPIILLTALNKKWKNSVFYGLGLSIFFSSVNVNQILADSFDEQLEEIYPTKIESCAINWTEDVKSSMKEINMGAKFNVDKLRFEDSYETKYDPGYTIKRVTNLNDVANGCYGEEKDRCKKVVKCANAVAFNLKPSDDFKLMDDKEITKYFGIKSVKEIEEKNRLQEALKIKKEKIRWQQFTNSMAPLKERIAKYPKKAKRNKITGYAITKFTILENGKVAKIELIEESPKNYDFGLSAMKATRKLKYPPPIYDEKPVSFTIEKKWLFSID